MGNNAVQDGGVVATNDATDFGIAIGSGGVVPHEPPQFVSGSGDGVASSTPAKFVAGDTALIAHRIDDIEQAACRKSGDDSIGVGRRGHALARGDGDGMAHPNAGASRSR